MLQLILMATLAYAGSAPPWQSGQVIAASSERVFAGTAEDPGSVFDGRRARYVSVRSYTIRSGDREYIVTVQPSRYSVKIHVPRVVVNTAIKFRVEKTRATFLDDDGREFKGQVERETAIKP